MRQVSVRGRKQKTESRTRAAGADTNKQHGTKNTAGAEKMQGAAGKQKFYRPPPAPIIEKSYKQTLNYQRNFQTLP